ncbi:MAG: carbohydrate ABC transporter permease [Clostridium sp.]|nr:carbohydrate ABC transporter permease [Clostridium sp.]MCM1172734.1 carbohydrate ABC transporter permease [Clostridium sp.]MCM1209133.1 carbohydrate ABC transporter permease [Ruminococcus sp.]
MVEKNSTGTKVLRYVVCILLCFLSIMPFYIMIVNSTLDNPSILTGIKFIPGSHFFENFKGLLKGTARTSGVNVLKAMLNSLIITVPAVILQVYFASLTAYAVTVYNFKLKRFAWGFIYAIMMIPQQVSIVGFIKVCNITHLYGSYLAMIIPAMAAPTTVYFMKQYMETGLSVEIVEAARIDGSSELHTFNRIVLPLLKPAMATQAIFAFVSSWNNLYTPSIILATEREKATMPMFVEALKSNDKERDWGMIYCGLFVTVLPLLVMYFALSKYIIAGVALGGVKE